MPPLMPCCRRRCLRAADGCCCHAYADTRFISPADATFFTLAMLPYMLLFTFAVCLLLRHADTMLMLCRYASMKPFSMPPRYTIYIDNIYDEYHRDRERRAPPCHGAPRRCRALRRQLPPFRAPHADAAMLAADALRAPISLCRYATMPRCCCR